MTRSLEVEDADHPKALIIRGIGKFFSNGLDLQFMTSSEPSATNEMIESVWKLLARLLVLDCRTVAAINGHAFGAGLFLALACDFRIMRTQRGYLNFPELNLGMRLGKGFAELSKSKITSSHVLREGVLTGKRYDSTAALQSGLVDEECSIETLPEHAEALAMEGLPEELGAKFFDATSFQQMKMELYTDAYRTLISAQVESLPESRL